MIRRPLRKRLLQVVVLSTACALLVAASALLLYDMHSYHVAALADLSAQAEILARNVGPTLAFSDPQSAQADLNSLRGKRSIHAAAIFKRNDEFFVGFDDDGPVSRMRHIPDGTRVVGNAFEVAVPVLESKERLGTVYLRGQYPVAQRMRDYFLILMAIMVPSLLVALVFSIRLQRSITEPMRALTDAAEKFIRTHEFSEHVEKLSDDEIGVFVEAFNSMVTELSARTNALETADRKKDEFLATLAHELRNPLSPMVNAIAIMEKTDDVHLRDKAREMIGRQVKHMVRLVNDLLDMSRISTGKLSVQMKTIDLRSVLLNAVESVRPLCDRFTHLLTVDAPTEPLSLSGDETRLTQVFVNLLDNAAKYTPPGGRISVAVNSTSGVVAVKISDTGIGVDPDKLAYVFDMFAQLDNPLERMKSGLGVGLALAKRLVELHGGSISVESHGRDQGTTFTVSLPRLIHPQSASKDMLSPIPTPRLAHWRILLVDDNADHVQSLGFLFTSLGHDVRVVFDGASALQLLKTWHPDVACLDIGMPDMNGYELARRIRTMSAYERLPLIAMTGWGQSKDKEMAAEAGFNHHLIKPIGFDLLLEIIETVTTVTEPL